MLRDHLSHKWEVEKRTYTLSFITLTSGVRDRYITDTSLAVT